jgi:hypothetical protein
MDHEIELAPELLDLGEDRVDGRTIGDVAVADDRRVEFLRQWLHALLECVALIGERELGAVPPGGLRDAPRNRAVVGNAHYQAALAGKDAGRRCLGHESPKLSSDTSENGLL